MTPETQPVPVPNAEGDESTAPTVSVVIPVYNSAGCLEELVRRLAEALGPLPGTNEVVLVNDGSPDASWETIIAVQRRYPNIIAVNLRRNFGQDNAIMAGLRVSRGQVVVIMDDDLQHDPRDIPALVRVVESGYDVCYALFPRKRQAWWKNFGSWLNGKVAEFLLGKPRHIYLSPFKALQRALADEITRYEGPYPYIDGLILRATSKLGQVVLEHHPRYAGCSNYSLRRSVRVWLRVVTTFSVVPLRVAGIVGALLSFVGTALAVLFVARQLLGTPGPEGWASTIVAVLVMGGVQLLSLGVLGEYVGRLYILNNRSPQYVIREIRRSDG